jgi:hypothetical protein
MQLSIIDNIAPTSREIGAVVLILASQNFYARQRFYRTFFRLLFRFMFFGVFSLFQFAQLL